jgi:hypothetical protein
MQRLKSRILHVENIYRTVFVNGIRVFACRSLPFKITSYFNLDCLISRGPSNTRKNSGKMLSEKLTRTSGTVENRMNGRTFEKRWMNSMIIG